jgi:hypothetical protein
MLSLFVSKALTEFVSETILKQAAHLGFLQQAIVSIQRVERRVWDARLLSDAFDRDLAQYWVCKCPTGGAALPGVTPAQGQHDYWRVQLATLLGCSCYQLFWCHMQLWSHCMLGFALRDKPCTRRPTQYGLPCMFGLT